MATARGDVGGGEVARLGLDGIDDDVDLPHPPAVGRGAGHAGDAFEQRLDVVERVVVELRARCSPRRVTTTWTTGALDGSYWSTNGGRTPSDLGTAAMANAACCCTSVCAELRSVPHLSHT